MRYRLYIDEAGDHTCHNADNINYCYLGLTGIIIECENYRTTIHPKLYSLKQSNFPHNPDIPVILHRDDIIKKRDAFRVLWDTEKNKKWEESLIDFIDTSQFEIITVVIDKQKHIQKHGERAYHPYHRCLEVMLNLYKGFLASADGVGDVLAESRGGTEDRLLKAIYQEIYKKGTYWAHGDDFQKVLTSKELKVKPKKQNIAGLQIADLVAHDSRTNILASNKLIKRPDSPFVNRLIQALSLKYNTYGQVLL